MRAVSLRRNILQGTDDVIDLSALRLPSLELIEFTLLELHGVRLIGWDAILRRHATLASIENYPTLSVPVSVWRDGSALPQLRHLRPHSFDEQESWIAALSDTIMECTG